jgi:hypothetical protein
LLHVTNGSSVQIQDTGIGGAVEYWRDVLHEGPVPSLPLEELSDLRAEFIAQASGLPPEEVLRDFEDRDSGLRAYGDHDELVLWFEHDLYDQLQLIQILAWVAAHRASSTRVTLIQADDYLGRMTPDELSALFPSRRAVSPEQFRTAERAWQAFTATCPEMLVQLLGEDTSELRHLKAALHRLLEEFPSTRDGLSRTERQILQAVANGARTMGDAFRVTTAMEERIFMGDSAFGLHLRALASCRNPLLQMHEHGSVMKLTLQITANGRDVLAGTADHIRFNGIDRWLGGTHLSHPEQIWRFNGATLVRQSAS